MSEARNRIQKQVKKLATAREELRVQLDLGKKDLEDAWNEVE